MGIKVPTRTRASMSSERRSSPRRRRWFRGSQFRDLSTALIVGLICAALVGVMLVLIYAKQRR